MTDLVPAYDTWLIALSFVGPALLVVLAAWYFSSRADRALARFAAENSFPFDPAAAGVPDIAALSMPCVSYAAFQTYNYVKVPETPDWRAFYAEAGRRETGAPAGSAPYFTFALFELKSGTMPAFCMRPEAFGSGLAAGEDIDLPGHAKFSSLYHVSGPDRDAVASFFSGPAELLAERPGWTVSGKGRYLLVYRRDTRVGASAYRDFMNDTRELAEVFRRAAKGRSFD